MKKFEFTDEQFVTLTACVKFTYGEECFNHEFETHTDEKSLLDLMSVLDIADQNAAGA